MHEDLRDLPDKMSFSPAIGLGPHVHHRAVLLYIILERCGPSNLQSTGSKKKFRLIRE